MSTSNPDLPIPNLPDIFRSHLIGDDDISNTAWASSKRLLTPWIPDRFKFAFNDPKMFSRTPTNPDVFEELLNQLSPAGTFTESQLATLVHAVSTSCLKSEWKSFYQPILKRTAKMGRFGIGVHNDAAPKKYQIRPFAPQTLVVAHPPVDGLFYQHDDVERRMFVLIYPDWVELVTDEFDSWDFPDIVSLFEKLCNQPGIEYPMVFEGYSNGYELLLTDVFSLKHIAVWPGAFRRIILETSYTTYLADSPLVLLGEGIPGGHSTDIDQIRKHFNDMTQSGSSNNRRMAIFKPNAGPYTHKGLLVPLEPLTPTP